jgi:hypothetical protein
VRSGPTRVGDMFRRPAGAGGERARRDEAGSDNTFLARGGLGVLTDRPIRVPEDIPLRLAGGSGDSNRGPVRGCGDCALREGGTAGRAGCPNADLVGIPISEVGRSRVLRPTTLDICVFLPAVDADPDGLGVDFKGPTAALELILAFGRTGLEEDGDNESSSWDNG